MGKSATSKKRKISCVHSRPNGFLCYLHEALRREGESQRHTTVCQCPQRRAELGTLVQWVGAHLISMHPLNDTVQVCYCLRLTEKKLSLQSKLDRAISLLKMIRLLLPLGLLSPPELLLIF